VPGGEGSETEAQAVVDYAVLALEVSNIIVRGHSDRGAMKALLDPGSLQGLPTVATWLANAGPTLANVCRKHGHLEGKELLDATIRENVLVQLDHLRPLPDLAPRLADGRVTLHGWVHEFETGEVLAHDPPPRPVRPARRGALLTPHRSIARDLDERSPPAFATRAVGG